MLRVAARAEKALHVGMSAIRLAHLRLRLGRDALPGIQNISAGVRISVASTGHFSLGVGSALEVIVTLQVRGRLSIRAEAFVGEGA